MDKLYNNIVHLLEDNQFYIEYQEPPMEMDHFHWHNHIEFNYLYSGSMEYIFGDQSCIIPARKLVFFWGGIPHKSIKVHPARNNEPARLCNLYYPLEKLLLWDKSEETQNMLMQGSMLVLDSPTDFMHMLIDVWRKDVAKRNQEAIEAISLEIQALLNRYHCTQLLAPSLAYQYAKKRMSAHKQKVFVRILRYILQNLQEPLSASIIAKHLGYHPNHIQRTFEEVLGASIHQFVIRTRLTYACSLLSETNRAILDIAIETGFGSISQFYKCFQQQYHQTPKQYRQQKELG